MPKAAEAWVESLSPWPEEFGLEGMRALLGELGDPQRRYRAIHVVGSKGKSTAARTIGALLRADGLRTGVYTSPHVSGWAERIEVEGREGGFERAIGRVRAAAEAIGATQFEVLTAAAFAEFAAAGVEVAVVEAGLGGRLDATNIVDAEVALLTNVLREHTDVLGETPEEIAAEKLAVAHAARVVVLPDNSFSHLVPAGAVTLVGGAREAAEAFVDRPLGPDPEVTLPGRLELRVGEVRDGAHTPEAVDWLLAQLPRDSYVICASVLADKDADAILERLAAAGTSLVATQSSNPRALAAEALAERARAHFEHVETVPDPHAALARARELAGPDGAVLVTGSLYLLADLHSVP
ncbi:MAG: glutamate ligase domain-containing protein [Gaiellaceae bacterium]